jgi:hypothetical protein
VNTCGGEWMYRSSFSWQGRHLEMNGQLHDPATLCLGKSPQYPSNRRLARPQTRSGRSGEKKILNPTGSLTLQSSSPKLVSIPIELSRFLSKIHDNRQYIALQIHGNTCNGCRTVIEREKRSVLNHCFWIREEPGSLLVLHSLSKRLF